MLLFFLLNAIFFGVLALVYTLKFFFRSVKLVEIPIWLGSFLWFSYAITRLFL